MLHRAMKEEAPVKFTTRDGQRIACDAKKKVNGPVKVKFMARDN